MEHHPDELEFRQRQRGKQFFAKHYADEFWNRRVDDFVGDIVWSRIQHHWTSSAPNSQPGCKRNICGPICTGSGG